MRGSIFFFQRIFFNMFKAENEEIRKKESAGLLASFIKKWIIIYNQSPSPSLFYFFIPQFFFIIQSYEQPSSRVRFFFKKKLGKHALVSPSMEVINHCQSTSHIDVAAASALLGIFWFFHSSLDWLNSNQWRETTSEYCYRILQASKHAEWRLREQQKKNH